PAARRGGRQAGTGRGTRGVRHPPAAAYPAGLPPRAGDLRIPLAPRAPALDQPPGRPNRLTRGRPRSLAPVEPVVEGRGRTGLLARSARWFGMAHRNGGDTCPWKNGPNRVASGKRTTACSTWSRWPSARVRTWRSRSALLSRRG